MCNLPHQTTHANTTCLYYVLHTYLMCIDIRVTLEDSSSVLDFYRTRRGQWIPPCFLYISLLVLCMSKQPSYNELVLKIASLEQRNKELNEELNKAKAVFQSADYGMALVDFEGEILEANAALCCILGYSREELLLRQASDFKPSRLLGEFRHHLDLIKKQRHLSQEVEYQHKNGRPIFGEITCSVIDSEGESMIDPGNCSGYYQA